MFEKHCLDASWAWCFGFFKTSSELSMWMFCPTHQLKIRIGRHCIVKTLHCKEMWTSPTPKCTSTSMSKSTFFYVYILWCSLDNQSVLMMAIIFNQFKKQNTFLAISDCHSAHYATLSWAEKLKKHEKLPKKLRRYAPTKGNQ